MKTRVCLIITIALLLSLVATTTATAKGGPDKRPTWEQAFNPVPPMGEGANTLDGVEFKGKMYFTFTGTDSIDQVWGSPDGKNWSWAWDASTIQEGYEGTGTLTVFKGQLYTWLADWDEQNPAQIMRTRNGVHWEAVASDPGGWISGGGTSFQGSLYVGICHWYDESHDCGLMRSISGAPGTWEEVAMFPEWNDIASFASFKGALYVQSTDVFDHATGEGLPTQIWRSYDGVSWEPVNTDGCGDPTNNFGGGLGVYAGYLYAGTGNLNVAGGDIWRSRDGLSWEPVTTDGFGNPANLVMAGFATYKGMLVAYSASFEGTEVYISQDGLRWKLTNEAGWGNSGNLGINRDHGQVVFKEALYLGVVGPAGVMRYGK